MMFRRLFALGLLAFLFFGLLGFIGRATWARSESAWMQGYLAGQQAAASSEDDAANAQPPRMYPDAYGYGRYHSHFRGGFFPGLGLFTCLIPLFLLGGFFFLMGPRRRRWYGSGPCGHHPHGRHHQHGRHKPPWVDDDDLADEPVMKA